MESTCINIGVVLVDDWFSTDLFGSKIPETSWPPPAFSNFLEEHGDDKIDDKEEDDEDEDDFEEDDFDDLDDEEFDDDLEEDDDDDDDDVDDDY